MFPFRGDHLWWPSYREMHQQMHRFLVGKITTAMICIWSFSGRLALAQYVDAISTAFIFVYFPHPFIQFVDIFRFVFFSLFVYFLHFGICRRLLTLPLLAFCSIQIVHSEKRAFSGRWLTVRIRFMKANSLRLAITMLMGEIINAGIVFCLHNVCVCVCARGTGTPTMNTIHKYTQTEYNLKS